MSGMVCLLRGHPGWRPYAHYRDWTAMLLAQISHDWQCVRCRAIRSEVEP